MEQPTCKEENVASRQNQVKPYFASFCISSQVLSTDNYFVYAPIYWYCQNRSLSRQATGIYFYQDRSLLYILALKVYVLLKTHNSGVRNASFHLVKWQGLLPRSYMQYTSQILPSLLQKLILTKLQGQGNTTDW